MAIAVQTTRGLAYLHEYCKQWIVHSDVKPENILLDSSYCAKVADFGVFRIKNRNQIMQTLTKTMNIRGMMGDLASEYWLADRVSITNKMDVFSYGMVLLENISGRHNLLREASMDAPDLNFPMWAFPKLEAQAFMDVADPALVAEIEDPGEVQRALQVAFWCINEKPQVLPSRSEVVQMLQGHMAIKLPVPRPIFFDTLELSDESPTSQDSRLSSTTSSSTAAVEYVCDLVSQYVMWR